ncbi:MAG: EAL domain-containing protein [Verrucomicrobiota bacterium]
MKAHSISHASPSSNGSGPLVSRAKGVSISDRQNYQSLNLLLIEDNQDDAYFIKRRLYAKGGAANFHSTETLSSAKAILNSLQIDIILTDLHITDSSGLETLERLLAVTHQKIPIIVLSGLNDEELALKAVNLGAQDYLPKGKIDSFGLKRTILHSLERHQMLKAYEQKSVQIENTVSKVRAILEASSAMIMILDADFSICESNRTCQKILSRSFEQLNGSSLEDIMEVSREEIKKLTLELRELVTDSKDVVCFDSFLLPDLQGQRRYVSWKITRIEKGYGRDYNFIFTGTDITERYQSEQEKATEAELDTLTRLLNRSSLNAALENSILNAQCGKNAALVYVDLDNFKIINDTMGGHHSGDKVLVQVAEILRGAVRDRDKIFRCGGDEFVIILNDVDLDFARDISERINQMLDDLDIEHEGKCMHVSASLGITRVKPNVNAEDLINQADAACYVAKSNGRHCVEIYDEQISQNVSRTKDTDWSKKIQQSLKEDLFALWFQPICRTSSKEVIFHEVLLRLPGDDGDLLYPHQFFPPAKRAKLLKDIDHYVIGKSFPHLAENPQLRLSINLSGESIGESKIVNYIEGLLKQYKIDAERLVFEITESEMISNLRVTKSLMNGLRAKGFRFAIDDFGVGFSSLSHLRNLPVDVLKIDGSFIRNLSQNQTSRVFVRAINDIAHELGAVSIAEFVEDKETLGILQHLGIDYTQGYYLGRPSVELCP